MKTDLTRTTIPRRTLLAAAAAGTVVPWLSTYSNEQSSSLENLHDFAVAAVNRLTAGREIRLRLMYPTGCLGNIKETVTVFTQKTGVALDLVEVPLDEITEEILLEAEARKGSFDVALPATFGLPDLVESGILTNLDKYAGKYEPVDLQEDSLYTIGDYYKGSLYGYQTDGDTYMMFYLKDWLDDPEEGKKFADAHGYPLRVPRTWRELDDMMAHFHRPAEGRYGGALYRTEFFIAWEWWVRFHAKGLYPLSDDLTPRINEPAGVEALEELIAASKYLHPNASSNGLFENFRAFGIGNTFCNIGWGGTQKYLNGESSAVRNKLEFGPTPGGIVNDRLLQTPYFNWGWNYVVSAISSYPEIAYLFTLFASSPEMSTKSVRNRGGYFDPFRGAHYRDSAIISTYSQEFLKAHEVSMRHSIPDLYLKGQVEYFDELRLNVTAANVGEKSAKQALDDAASAWDAITDRMGRRSQRVQWRFLKSSYPSGVRDLLS